MAGGLEFAVARRREKQVVLRAEAAGGMVGNTSTVAVG